MNQKFYAETAFSKNMHKNMHQQQSNHTLKHAF